MKLFNRQFNFIALLFLIISCTGAPKEPVSYLAEPATTDEQAVANTIETMITSYSEQDKEKHLACYAPDARIDSKLAGGFVSRDEYGDILAKSGRLSTIRLKDVKITKVASDKCNVDARLSVPGRGTFPISYDLVPIEGRWLIIEQRYR